jgi:hypothetical protein
MREMIIDAKGSLPLGRRLFMGAAAAMVLVWAAPSWAGSYLDRSRILVRTALDEAAFLRPRVGNVELARVLHPIALARLEAARTMAVPGEVAQAHPHLLLVLENVERAYDAAIRKEPQRALVYFSRARDEEESFRAILKQLGFNLGE